MKPIRSFKSICIKMLAIVFCIFIGIKPSFAQVDYLIGNGTTANTCTGTPTPFLDYFETNRDQWLFLASELTAAGMGPGVITAIKWDVSSLGSSCTNPIAPLNGYTIKIGSTTTTALTGWVAGITTPVYGPATYTTTLGMNVFTLPTPFVWNGTDNIVIEICHDNSAGNYTSNASVNYTTTSFNSRYHNQTDNANYCGITTGSAYTTRPNTIFTFGLPCTGVPTTSVAGPNEICPRVPFTLGFTQFYSGINVQWQQSFNGTTWTNATGAVNAGGILATSINQDTWFRAVVTCISSGQTYTTPAKLVKVAPFYYCYCTSSKATAATGADIGNMEIEALSNGAIKLNNGSAVPVINNTNSNKGYSDFRYTVPAVPVYRDSSYVFTVSQINSAAFNSAMAAVYVDYNRNGRFDTSERLLIQATANTLPTPGVVKDTFRIPDTAGIGLTGMRVILRTGTVDPDTCIAYTDGETEDYLLDIRYEPCTGSVNPGVVVATDTSVCVGYRYSIADTTHERKKSDIKWWWQYSPDGRIWANLPNSLNKDTFNNIIFSNTIYYRVGTVCLNTMDTTYSTAQRIGQKAAYKCYCYSLADGSENDNNIDSSDIGAVGIGSMLFTSSGPHMGNESAVRSRTDYTDMVPVALETERRYRLLVYHTMNRYDHADAKVTVFMDFNNNKQYDIPQERVGTWFTSINNHTIIDSVYIPDSTIVNVPTGMRVILNNNVAPNIQSDFACGTYTSGETEDFIIMFKRPIVTGVQTLNGISNLGLYPNPTSGKFRIQFDGAAKELTVMVSTVTGQQVEQRTYNHRGGLFNEEIDMSSRAKGVYFVELQADGEKMTRKLVVQ